jgi:hypothetical protein
MMAHTDMTEHAAKRIFSSCTAQHVSDIRMAARITNSAVNFAEVAAKIPAAQKVAFTSLQNKVQVLQGLSCPAQLS